MLRKPLAERAHAALLIGAAAGKIGAQLEGAVPLVECGTLDAAIAHAYRAAVPGDTVLLAPACASFDSSAASNTAGRPSRRSWAGSSPKTKPWRKGS